MQKEWTPDISPAFISDDIAFVGGIPVSVHLIISKDGPILLDTGYPGMIDGIEQNMRKLGFTLRDVIAVIHTHGHIDHYGNTAEIVRLSGAKTYIGIEDEDIVVGKLDLSWAKELDLSPAEPFTPDVCFKDGDVLCISDRTIKCVHAPGHTEGTYAFFIETKINTMPAIAAMHGGVGINSMTKAFLESYNLPFDLRDRFREGLHRLSKEHVDIVLGNHPQQNDTEGKIMHMNSQHNPFVDSDEWPRFLKSCEAGLDNMIAGEADQ